MKKTFIVIAVLGFTCSWLLAHRGDPKTFQSTPAFAGKGYRSGATSTSGSSSPLGPPLFDADSVQLLSWITLPEFGSGIQNGNDCWGYVSPSGREYAIMCHYTGTSFVEITDPTNPIILEFIDGPDSLWRDAKTYQTYCYVVSEGGGGIQVVDLSDIDNGNVTFVGDVTTGGGTDSHNVAIDTESGFLYRCGGASTDGLRIYDLSNPAVPVFVGAWNDRYVHDAQIVTYTSGPYAGMQVAFTCGGFNGGYDQTGLDVLDVTNKGNITTLDQVIYGDGEYSHQAWLSPDRQYLYLNDELDEGNLGIPTNTKVFDVSDLTNVFEATEFTNGNPAIGHNVYTQGNLLYEANYQSGLRVFDVSNPLAATEIAWFDTYPEGEGVGFDGLWSVYPYFPSGTVIGSDLQRGLFVWFVGDYPLAFDYPNGIPATIEPAGDTMQVEIIEQNGTYEPGTASLFYDAGAGYQEVPLNSLGGLLFEAQFPATTCGEIVSFYVSAESTTGFVVNDPVLAGGSPYTAISAVSQTVVQTEDMEIDTGWTVGDPADDATTGVWERGDPIGTAAQPEDDHTAGGSLCWFTGQGSPGGSLGENDVDGGQTTLTTPQLDLGSLADPRIGYWRWYSNSSGASPNADVFVIDISSDDGNSWFNVETIGPTGTEVNGGWLYNEIRVSDFVTPTSTVRLRFIASDLDNGSIIEAAIDDLRVIDLDCGAGCANPFIRGDADGNGAVGLPDALVILNYLFAGGVDPDPLESADVNDDDGFDISDATYVLQYLFLMGPPPPPPFPDPGC